MNDEQLLRHLKTIGKSFFIKYLELIDDDRNSSASLVSRIVEIKNTMKIGHKSELIILEGSFKKDARTTP